MAETDSTPVNEDQGDVRAPDTVIVVDSPPAVVDPASTGDTRAAPGTVIVVRSDVPDDQPAQVVVDATDKTSDEVREAAADAPEATPENVEKAIEGSPENKAVTTRATKASKTTKKAAS